MRGPEVTVIYRMYKPGPPLAPWISGFWYCRIPKAVSRRERVLPTGDSQIILNLAADRCTGCLEDGTSFDQKPALLMGLRPAYTLIDAQDMEELMGVVVAPGGLGILFGEPAHRLGGEIALEDLWGRDAAALRDRLRETETICEKFAILDEFLSATLLSRDMHPAVALVLDRVRRAEGAVRVAKLASSTGLSSRRVGELFRDAVGVSPKCFARILRFRQAMRRLHVGEEPCWSELALDLGYYDQAHFNRDFREFSGLTPTAYVCSSRAWANHVSMEPRVA